MHIGIIPYQEVLHGLSQGYKSSWCFESLRKCIDHLTLSPCILGTCLFCSSSDLFPMRIFWTLSGAYWNRNRRDAAVRDLWSEKQATADEGGALRSLGHYITNYQRHGSELVLLRTYEHVLSHSNKRSSVTCASGVINPLASPRPHRWPTSLCAERIARWWCHTPGRFPDWWKREKNRIPGWVFMLWESHAVGKEAAWTDTD